MHAFINGPQRLSASTRFTPPAEAETGQARAPTTRQPVTSPHSKAGEGPAPSRLPRRPPREGA